MPSILFVCSANQFRSPIAAACLLKNIKQVNRERKWIVESAGTWTSTGLLMPDFALQVGNQLGLDGLANHQTRQVDQKLLNEFDLIIVMEIGHKEAIIHEFPSVVDRLYLLSEIVDDISYDIPDPTAPGVNPNDIGREINNLIKEGKENILDLAESISKYRLPEG